MTPPFFLQMKRFLNYISSRRFAIFLLVVTASVILLSSLLPKPFLMDAREVEKLKKDRPLIYALSTRVGIEGVVRSPYFRVIPVFIFLSVTACTLRRLRAELEKGGTGEVIPEELPIKHSITLKPGSLKEDKIVLMLKKKRWRLLVSEEQKTVIYGVKGENGIWGSLGFHIGMNAALVGIFISIATGMDGKLMLTEGFPATTPKEVRGMEDAASFPFTELMLESFEPVFEGGFPVRYDSHLLGIGRDGRPARYKIGVNNLLKLGDDKFIFSTAGFAPRFRLKKDGKEVADAITNLLISMPGVVDYVGIPEEGIGMKVEIFPDHYVENGDHKTKGKFPFNPALFVEVEKFGKVIGRGFLTKGQTVDMENYSLEFVELRNWMELVVSRDAGVPVIMTGFIIIVLGLCMRFILNDKRFWIIISDNDSKLEIGGKARFFPALFEEELKRLAEDVERMGMKGEGI